VVNAHEALPGPGRVTVETSNVDVAAATISDGIAKLAGAGAGMAGRRG
jgi:hypothetical protein